jgi:hypothetical protein
MSVSARPRWSRQERPSGPGRAGQSRRGVGRRDVLVNMVRRSQAQMRETLGCCWSRDGPWPHNTHTHPHNTQCALAVVGRTVQL